MSLAPESISARVEMVFPRVLSRTGSLRVLDILFVVIMVGCFRGVVRGLAPLRENPSQDHLVVERIPQWAYFP